MNLLKKIALRETMKKAIELHKAGLNIEQIKAKFYTEPKVTEGFVALGIDDKELTKLIEKEINKHK